MPPADLENPVPACAGESNSSKITGDNGSIDGDATEDVASAVYEDPDFPPESFWLSKDAEYDWFDRNVFYDRSDSSSGRGNSNSSNSNSTSNSQRFSVRRKSRAALIGLPKTQKTTYTDSKRRTCRTVNVRLFPKRPEPAGKSATALAEPGSPKVSCIGRVRSKRGRRRPRRREKPSEKARSDGEKQKKKVGLYSKMMSMFRRKKPLRSGSRRVVDEPAKVVDRRLSLKVRVEGERAGEPPGLGGVKRFVSGRRSESWAVEEFSTVSDSLDEWHVGVVSWS